MIGGLELSVPHLHSPPHTSRVGARGWKVTSFTNSQWFTQSCLFNETSIKPQRYRFQRVSRLVNTWRCGESSSAQSGNGNCAVAPHCASRLSPPSTCSWLMMFSCFSCVQLFETLWTVAHQALLSTGFPRQEHWSGLPFTSPGDLPNPGIEPASLVSPALAGGFFTSWAALPYKIVVETKWDNPRNTLHVVNIL